MSDNRLTFEEVTELFGGTIPMEALNILCSAPDNKTIEEVRDEITTLALNWNRCVAAVQDNANEPRSLTCIIGLQEDLSKAGYSVPLGVLDSAFYRNSIPAPAVPDDVAELARRLRGEYRIPITDGLGAVGGGEEPNNQNEFVRRFETPPIQKAAADALEAQAAELARHREALQPFASAWRIAQASGLTSMSHLGSLARNEVAAVAFMKAAALTHPTGEQR